MSNCDKLSKCLYLERSSVIVKGPKKAWKETSQ